MPDVVDSDLNKGPEVKWYSGGVAEQISHTVTSSEVTAGGFALGTGKTADYGLIVVTKGEQAIPFTAFKADGSTPATEDSGIEFVKYTGITVGDVVTIYFVNVATTFLSHIASAEDFKSSSKADSKKTAVHGQKNKIISTGVMENSGDFSMLQMGPEFKALFVGDLVTGPKTGEKIWTTKTNGFKKVGCLVGKKMNSSGAIVHKWGLIGVSYNALDQDFPTEENYKDSFKVDVEYLIEWEAA